MLCLLLIGGTRPKRARYGRETIMQVQTDILERFQCSCVPLPENLAILGWNALLEEAHRLDIVSDEKLCLTLLYDASIVERNPRIHIHLPERKARIPKIRTAL